MMTRPDGVVPAASCLFPPSNPLRNGQTELMLPLAPSSRAGRTLARRATTRSARCCCAGGEVVTRQAPGVLQVQLQVQLQQQWQQQVQLASVLRPANARLHQNIVVGRRRQGGRVPKTCRSAILAKPGCSLTSPVGCRRTGRAQQRVCLFGPLGSRPLASLWPAATPPGPPQTFLHRRSAECHPALTTCYRIAV